MGKTKHTFKGKEYPAKTKKKIKDVKHFGFTSGLHSEFEKAKDFIKKEFEDSEPTTDPYYLLKSSRWEAIKDKTYPQKNVDFIKYAYGRGMKKEKKVKNYKKEIE